MAGQKFGFFFFFWAVKGTDLNDFDGKDGVVLDMVFFFGYFFWTLEGFLLVK